MRDLKASVVVQLILPLLLAGGFIVFIGKGIGSTSVAQAAAQRQETTLQSTVPLTDSTLYLPLVTHDYLRLATRLGYGATNYPISRYPDLRSMHAGWYLDWSVQTAPVQPNGTEYAQVIMVHQKLACGDFINGDRVACPYAQPLDYVYLQDQATIELAARNNPGQLWFIGNEMDRVDWLQCNEYEADGRTCKPGKVTSAGQSEMLPETYARAYHDLYTIIKAADPTARLGMGGVIQATPLRLQYLTIVWDTYKALYGQDMPVDVWNVHNFILREQRAGYGADIPPGIAENSGAYIGNDCTHTDRTIFDTQIRAFRQWMKDRGQQEKPLMVNEYGVLWSHTPQSPNNDGGKCKTNFNNEQHVHDFMLWSFDYFLNTKDCNLGYGADECRLVQRWIWFSLDHVYNDANGNPIAGLNLHASLINGTTYKLTKAGELFRQFALNNLDALHQD